MKTITIKDEFADIATKILTAALGEGAFEEKRETPKSIDSLEDALKINGTTLIPTFSEFKEEKLRKHHLADWQWGELATAYNKLRNPEYKADYLDEDQDKYYAWCTLKEDKSQPSGFGLSRTDYNYTYTNTGVGVRHAFASSNDVLDALKKFGQIYITMQTN